MAAIALTGCAQASADDIARNAVEASAPRVVVSQEVDQRVRAQVAALVHSAASPELAAANPPVASSAGQRALPADELTLRREFHAGHPTPLAGLPVSLNAIGGAR